MNRNSKIKKKPAVKPLEEMNVLDNFLFTELAGNPEFREQFGRIILSVFLQRKLGKITVHAQSVFQGDGPLQRGIRLDVEVKEYLDEFPDERTEERKDDTKEIEKADYCVYDMEAQIRKVNALPKRSRFYQAKLDGKHLDSGEKNWNMLPDLYVVMITSYDPFGYDYMMYTIHNQCKEVPELEYEDGLTYLYFYTGGKKGGNEEIKSLLTYLQSSIIENAKDEATQSIHESVEKIKRSAEVRGKYMTVGEMMDYYKELGYEEGKEEGLEVGREEGREEGRAEGRVEGRVEGRAEGHAKGYAAGLLTGLLNLLSDLGDIPDQVRQQAEKLDADGIKQWSKQASRSDSMEEFLQKI